MRLIGDFRADWYLSVLYYCREPFYDCKNDGRQFHMSKLVENGGDSGFREWPYDPSALNKFRTEGVSQYQIDGEGTIIRAYNLLFKITGSE